MAIVRQDDTNTIYLSRFLNSSVFPLLSAVGRATFGVIKGEFLQLPHGNPFGLLPEHGEYMHELFKGKVRSPVRGLSL